MIFFALEGDAVVGTVAMIRVAPDRCELAKMAVAITHQRRGIGELLGQSAAPGRPPTASRACSSRPTASWTARSASTSGSVSAMRPGRIPPTTRAATCTWK